MTQLNILSSTDKGTFEEVISGCSSDIQEIASALRALLADIMPNITEVPWANQRIVGYGVGVKKMSEHFCYIAPYKSYVNLGFMYGSDLPDPDGLLEGSGRQLRHIKISRLEDVANPSIRTLIELASGHLPNLKS